MATSGDVSKGKTLSSWKEIAARLGVTVRTAQRWEQIAGLPVHRQGAGRIGRIYAHADEIDRWLAEGGPARCEPEESAPSPAPARRSLYLVVGAAALLAAAAGILAWVGGWIPGSRVPAIWSVESSRLVIRDSQGRLCWQKQFPHLNRNYEGEVRDKVLIEDIDGDGRPEVLFNFFPDDMSHSASSLMCFGADGRLRWEYRYGMPKTFGNRYFEPTYRGVFLRPVRIGGKLHLLAVSNHYVWYPTQVSLLSATTGRLVEQYWHPGAIYECALADLDHDGEAEFVFGAINNPGEGPGHPAVGVLKLPFSRAAKPAAPDTAFPPLTGGGEAAYALLPAADVSQVLSVLPTVVGLRVDPDRIFVKIPLPENGAIIYYLDFRLNTVEYRFSDNFAPLHERLYRQHLLDHPLSPAETASLGKAVPFDAAPDGNSALLKRFWKY